MSICPRLLLAASLLVLDGCSTTGERSSSLPTLVLTIPLDTHGERRAVVDCHPPDPFHVLLTNAGKRPVKLWQEWVSLGYYSLQFEIIDQNGQRHLLKKKPTDFLANGPASFVLQPAESVVWDVELTSNVWQNLSWIPDDKELKAQVRAIYNVETDAYSKQFGAAWAGRVVSQLYNFSVYRAANDETK